MIIEKYYDLKNIIERLHCLFYTATDEFVDDILKFTLKDYKGNKIKAIELSKDILKYGIITNKIVIIAPNGIIYNKNNFHVLLEIIEIHFDEIIDIKNTSFAYLYMINYTDEWIEELKNMGVWEN